jgi:hypothetical protein
MKERFGEVRGDVKIALDQARDARKRRKEMPSLGSQKKRKSARSSDSSMETPQSRLFLPDAAQSVNEGEVPFDSLADQSLSGLVGVEGPSCQADFNQSLGRLFGVGDGPSLIHQAEPNQSNGLVGVNESLSIFHQATTEVTAATPIDGSNHSCHAPLNYMQEFGAPVQQTIPSLQLAIPSTQQAMSPAQQVIPQPRQAIPSEPPNLWEMAAWPTNTDWNSGQASL